MRLVLETLAIFAGVTLGFLAEDYREARGDRGRERETLIQLLTDLRTDSLELVPILASSEIRERALTWINNNAGAASFTADSVQRVLNPMRAFDDYIYVPGIFAYSSLKSSGRLDIIADPALRDQMVYYFEDRVPYMLSLNGLVLQEENEWWDLVAPYVAQEPREILDQMPALRVVNVDGVTSDRRLLWASAELGYLYFLQVRLIRQLYTANGQLAAAVRAYLR